jgi:hypothetical protein
LELIDEAGHGTGRGVGDVVIDALDRFGASYRAAEAGPAAASSGPTSGAITRRSLSGYCLHVARIRAHAANVAYSRTLLITERRSGRTPPSDDPTA